MQNKKESTLQYIRSQIRRLLRGEVDMSELLITKALKRRPEEYASSTKMAHVELCKRMKKRDAGSEPVVGDRVPYVMVTTSNKAKAHEKAEDPLYALENDIQLDSHWYLQHQLIEPIKRILTPILTAPELTEITSGDHTHVAVSRLPAASKVGLFRTMLPAPKCLGCKAPMQPAQGALCLYCKPTRIRHYKIQLEELHRCEEQTARLWTQCQRCTAHFEEDDRCGANDCPIYYMRKRSQKDLSRTRIALNRFELSW
jgi:DNA polymerase delta subunit 1